MGHSVMLKVQFKIKVNSYELCGSNNLATILSKIYKGYKEKIKHVKKNFFERPIVVAILTSFMMCIIFGGGL